MYHPKPLKGFWFYSPDPEHPKRPKLQGRIRNVTSNGKFLAELYSWGLGDIYEEREFEAKDIANWRFFGTDKIMRDNAKYNEELCVFEFVE